MKEAFSKGLSALRTKVPVRASVWAAQNFWLSPESSAVEGEFRPWPYQTAIMDCMGNDDVRVVTFLKSARIGYTKMLAAVTAYFHEHKRRNGVIYQPTDADAKEFCKDTIDPMIRDCRVLQSLMMDSSKNSKENTLATKYFFGSSLHIRGGTSANNYRRLTKDFVVYDELDGFPIDIDGEGSPVSLGDKRVQDSSFPKSIRGTTPTIYGRSLIQQSLESADVTFKFHVPCPDCDEFQPMEWGGKESDYGIKWEDDDYQTAHYVCRGCKAHWFYDQSKDIQALGQWRAELTIDADAPPTTVYIDGESDLRRLDDDSIIEWPRHVAFVLWAAYSFTFPWPDMVHEFLAAKDDPLKLKTFTNTTLGELWHEASVSVESEPLFARRELYTIAPAQTAMITFAADVQVDRIECEFVAWGPDEESWSLDYVIIPGNPQNAEVWAALKEQIRRKFQTADGRSLVPRLGCVDSGYLPDQVYKFAKANGSNFVFPVKGSSVSGKAIANIPRKLHPQHRIYLVEVGTDTAKEIIYRRLVMERPGPGYMHYPIAAPYDEEFFRQLTGEEKRAVKRHGRTVMVFQAVYARVEVLDCRVYNLVACRIAQQRFRVNLGRFATTVASESAPQAQPEIQVPATVAPVVAKKTAPAKKPQTRPRSAGGGWMARYRR